MSSRLQPAQPGDPRRIGPFRVVGRLGAGGMGTVHGALALSGMRVAVKVVHPALAADDEFRARFRREVQLSRRVTGPCLVPVLDADTESSVPWLATEFFPGPTLDQFLAASGALSGARLCALAAGTAAALAAVHDAGVVHRDVKPQNVILGSRGPRVLDFGIAHALDGTSVTRTGVLTGTPGWISPEHYRTGAVGPEGDVFAWGALIANAATGRLPFGTGASDAVAFRVMSAEPDLVGVPHDLQPLVEQALSKSPSDRPTAAELSHRCADLLAAQATDVTPRPEGQSTLVADLVSLHWELPHEDPGWAVAPRGRRGVRLYSSVVAAALVVGGIGGALAATNSSSGQGATVSRGSTPKMEASTAGTAAVPGLREKPEPAGSSAPPSPDTTSMVSAEAQVPSTPPQDPPFVYLPDQVDCRPQKQADISGAWQYVAPGEVRAGDAVELSLRNKYGNFDPVQAEMSVLARVYMPDGTSRLARSALRSDTSAAVTWPGDFAGADALFPPGTYTVVWSVGDGSKRFIACTGFVAH
ncbi:serine/threonine-protein kinase [Streptomyces sp. NPDC055089]